LANITPVKPPNVNSSINPYVNNVDVVIRILPLYRVAIHENILIPVGIAIIIVALVKYALVSVSKPTVYI
jgi:hypothetical protein